jgi:hypothetical protein
MGLVRQLPCLLVPLQGGPMAAHALLGVAEGLQGSGFEGLDADLAGELEGLAGQLERLVVAAGIGVDAGKVAERVGLAASVADLPEPSQGLGEVVECLVEPAPVVADLAQPVEQAGARGRLRLEGQRGGELLGGLLEHPEFGGDAGEVPEHAHLPRPRAGAPGDGQAPGQVGGGWLELARTPVGQPEPVEGDGLAF